jgi:hypothetical protein
MLAPDVADLARAAAVEIRAFLGRHVEEAIKVGKRLLEVKVAIPHGEFGRWLAAEFGMSERTARNYMSVAETFGNANRQQLPFLPLRSVYMLAAPSTPPAAREQVQRNLNEGKPLTEADVHAVVKAERKRIEAEKRRQEEECRKAHADAAKERRTKAYRERKTKKEAEERAAREAESRKRETAAKEAEVLIIDALSAEQRRRLAQLLTDAGWDFHRASLLKQLARRLPRNAGSQSAESNVTAPSGRIVRFDDAVMARRALVEECAPDAP